MIETVILHIGLHKTGTTSFQRYILENDDLFTSHGIEPYRPLFRDNSRTSLELGFAVLRPGSVDNLTPMLWNVDVCNADRRDWHGRLQQHLRKTCEKSRHGTLLISGEHLSFVRTPGEIQQLKALFPPTVTRFRILLVLRDRNQWWKSYRAEVKKWKHLIDAPIGPGINEYAHSQANSWLTDWDGLIRVYREGFGDVELIPYTRNIIPSLLLALDIPAQGNCGLFLNHSRRSVIRRALQRLLDGVCRR